jgi:hypothetical protein
VFDLRAMTIISGGQTGADRAALDFALEHGLSYGGWCPRGRRAEDGAIPSRYVLRQTPSRRYAERTEWNVRDSDATVTFTIAGNVTGGTLLTLACARRLGKPLLHLSRHALAAVHGDREAASVAASLLLAFLNEYDVGTLNVAGPRGSQEPEAATFVRDVLQRALIRPPGESS